MKPKFFFLMNHELTQAQETEIKYDLGCERLIEPPEEIKQIWRSVNPSGQLDLQELAKVIRFLQENAAANDYVLVQGEFGATFYIVDFCFKNGLIPVYATSIRKYNEKKDSTDAVERYHLFRHIKFRQYLRWEK